MAVELVREVSFEYEDDKLEQRVGASLAAQSPTPVAYHHDITLPEQTPV
jgi:hypothetical protein